MKPGAEKALTAWGRSSRSMSRVWDTENEMDVLTAMRAAGSQGAIARGYARSYGDACLNDGGEVLDMRSFSQIHSFDQEAGILSCDAGVSFRRVMSHCTPLGWQPFACPGTAFVTMGGAVANDVHGKDPCSGSFGDHLDWFDLRLPDQSVRRVTREADPELFAATIGGIGLTGVIQRVQFRLRRAPSNAMELKVLRVPDLEGFVELLQSSQQEYPFVVGWLDALSSRSSMGRGLLELARPSPENVPDPMRIRANIPFDCPAFLLNRYSVRAFNEAYFRSVPRAGRVRRVHVNNFLFPLDAIHNWNRLYGRNGLFQFQCVVPFSDGKRALSAVMKEVIRSRSASFLAVLKCMKRSGHGMLSFSMPGFSLALDFPINPETRPLIERLYDIILAHGGRAYLAKDACLSPKQFEAMYPQVERFKAVLRRVDPDGILQSDMSRRLNLRAR